MHPASRHLANAWRRLPRTAARGLLALLVTLAGLGVWTAARAAISYVGAAEAYDPDPTSALVIARPTGVTVGDLLLAGIAQPASNTIGTPTGWTLVATSQLNATNNPNLRVFYKVATGAEPTSYTFSTVGDESMAGGIAVFRGIDTSNPIAASAVQANSTASTGGVAPSVTPGVANTMLVGFWATHDNLADDPTVTVPGSMTRMVGTTMMAANTAETRLTMAREQLTADTATGTRTATLSTSYRSNTATVALRPAGYTVSGTVFEDVNYGGGAGRTLSASGGVGVNGATVELYNASGVYVSSTTTASGGAYSFTGLASGTYHVRVVNGTVPSQRSGTAGTLRGVMTYRTNAISGTPVAVTDYVGGTNPALVDPGAASSGATFNTGTGVYSAGLSGTAQSFTAVGLGSASITGVDFGFNFDTVVNTNDSGQGSLRQAVTNANTLSGDASLAQSGRTAAIENLVLMLSNGATSAGGALPGTGGLRTSIDYRSSGVHTIALTSGELAVSTAMAIQGTSAAGTAVSGNSSSRVFNATAALTLSDLTLRNGTTSTGNGGCILAATGNLSLANVALSTCTASNGAGGALASTAPVTSLSFVTLQGNRANTGNGGAVLLSTGVNTIADSVFSGNTATNGGGGGLWAAGGTNTVTDTGFAGNSSGSNGGGGAGMAAGSLDLTRVTFSGNAGGNGTGGGVHAANGTLALTNVTLNGNTSSTNGGGLSLAAGTATLVNVTVAGNSATNGAGGLQRSGGTLSLRNTIVASNTGTGGNCTGAITNTANNLDSGTTCGFGSTNGSLSSSNPLLSALASNGGSTQTMALGAGSPAINAGTSTSAPTTDQRGVARSGATDIGAYEYVSVTTYAISGTVFEDVNYGGGAGRTLSASGGVGVNGATVELYNASGVYVSSTTTASGGAYSFTGLASGTYHVRVVNGTVPSQRSGTAGTLRGVMTYRTNAISGTPVAVTDYVGGTNPALVDPGAASSGATFNTGTGVYSAGLSGTAQSFTAVGLGSASITGVDFGFNFDTVVNTNDSGQGSLRQAVTNANTLSGDASLAQSGRTAAIENLVLMLSNGATSAGGALPGTGGLRTSIDYRSSGVHTIALTSGELVVSTAMAIQGTSAAGTAVSGNSSSRVFNATAALTLSDLTLRNGTLGSGNGGCIQSSSSLTLNNTVFSTCRASNGYGGAIALASGSATIANSSFTGNQAPGGPGGAIVVNGSASLVVTDATFTSNSAGGGGAVWHNSTGSASLTRVTLAQNAAGSYSGGAIVVTGGTVALTNATLNANTSNNSGGLAMSTGTVTLTNVTIAGNSGGSGVGGLLHDGGTLSLRNTIVANNTGNLANCYGTITNAANNLDSGSGCGFGSSNGSRSNSNPLLSTLASNGGSTQTMALGASSPAINAGTATGAPTTDQRGASRSGTTDIGAYEYGGTVPGAYSVSGTVFEDLNYGGGAGRNRTAAVAAGGSARPGARVELASVSGTTATVVAATTTDAAGAYSFTGLSAGTYGVRVVSSSVSSARTGYVAGLLPVTTFRVNGTSGTLVDVTDEVGGGAPAVTSYAAVNANTGETSPTTVAYAEAVSYVALASANLSGVDFGFNFNTVTNVNPSGQGSLRQAITHANTLGGDAALQQTGRSAAVEHLVFMISNGSAAAGLRSSINYFSGGVATITPTSALPTLSTPMVVNAQTQPGWTSAPVVQLSGGSAGAGVSGLVLASSTGSTVRGLVIGGFNSNGISISSGSGHTVAGNHVGTNAAGTAAAANGGVGVNLWTVSNCVIGGTDAADRNVLSGNGNSGLVIGGAGGTGNAVRGNYIGLNAAGDARIANGAQGIYIASASNTVGGTASGAGNVVSGNTYENIVLASGATGTVVQGNVIGLNAQGSAALSNGGDGLQVLSANNTVGGTSTAARNVISGNGGDGLELSGASATGNTVQGNYVGTDAGGTLLRGNAANGIHIRNGALGNTVGGPATGAGNLVRGNARGIVVADASTGNALSANLTYGNTGLGIDLAGNGVSANDGAKSSGQPNLLMDAPVVTAAVLVGGNLTVSGYVGSAASQSTFAGSRVEFYESDAAFANGSGQAYLGALTADASGDFSGTLAVSGLSLGEAVTATATDGAGNTSEFGVNALATAGATVSGTVFEDVNYGGGAGRTLSASGGVGVNGATVELYNASGVYVSSTTTASGGAYSFTGLASGTYHVRVVNGTVPSQRSGTAGTLRGVMTYRTNASSGTPVAVTDYVGGTNPALVDPGAASSGATFNTGTGVYSAGLSGTAQSFTAVGLGSASITGVDFGFNFDAVVNTNDSGQGSLRQAITNANTLSGDASLAQSGRTAAIENLVFMISNGTAAAGLRSAYNHFTTPAGSTNVATIAPTSALPAVSAALVIDAQTQPGWTLNPVIELNGASAGSNGGLRLTVTGNTVRGLVINRFTGDGINLTAGGNTLSGNWIGTNAAGTAASANTVWGIEVNSSGNTIGGSTAAARNVISGNGDLGVYVRSGSNNLIQGNYIGTNAAGTAAVANVSHGVMVHSNTSANTVGGSSAGQGNVISGNGGVGVRLRSGSGSNTIRGNVIGLDAAAGTALPNAQGIQIDAAGNNNRIGGTAAGDGNIIAGNTGNGIAVFGTPAANGNAILGNSIYANGAIGIDLGTAAGSSGGDGITVNTGAKTSGQPNLLMNYPVVTGATLSGTTLTVAGYVGSAAGQSTFASSRVEVFVSDGSSTHGQGRTYLGFVTADANGNFSGPVTVPGSVTLVPGSTRLTGTATDTSNNTSEFGPNFTYGLGIGGTVFEDVHYGGGAGRSLGASGGVGVAGATVELYRASGAYVSTTTTASGGGYSFAGLAAEGYVVRVLTSSVRSTRTGSTAGLWPVQTWRFESSWLTPAAVTNEVGGARPGVADSAAAPTLAWTNCASETFGSTVNCVFTGTRVVRYGADTRWTTRVATDGVVCSNALFGDPAQGTGKTCEVLTPHLHSASSVHLAGAGATGVDFGFNFDTVVHTSDSGQGSLRQAITNANTLGGDAALAQSGRTAAIENLVFMIANGTSGAGLRSAYNDFTTPAGSTSVATIAPLSALPALSTAMVIDAQTQPGWSTRPVIELNGASAGASHGLNPSAAGSTLRGLVINRFAASGIFLGAAGNTVQGCWLGLNAAGTAAAGNGYAGIGIAAGSNTIGGTTATTRNVVSGNGSGAGTNNAGILVQSGSGNVILGNYVGLDPGGNTALPNLPYGVDVTGANTVIGGVASGAGNVISGNALDGIILRPGADGATIRGNTVGSTATNSGVVANGRIGIDLQANNATVGGAASGAANLVRGNATGGVVVVGNATGNAISANSVYGNGGLGIDLGYTQAVRPNDGAKTGGVPNQYMDHPVFTSARARADQLTVAGYVGSAAGQSAFGSSRVEVFLSDQDATGFGEGRTYLGALTADAGGNFSGSLTMAVSTLAQGSRLTGTATDASGNTSEFGANFTGLVVDFVVNTNADDADADLGDGLCLTAAGFCSLRAAIAELNAWTALAATPTVAFAIPACTGYGAAGCSIATSTALPSVTRAIVIDGSTQAGYSTATYAPIIELDGSVAPANASGLVVAADGSTVRALSVGGYGQSGIGISASGVTVEGVYAGLRADGVTARPNGTANSATGGVTVSSGTGIVGGSTPAQRNVLSGNGGAGLWVDGGTVTVTGNRIGTNATGTAAVGNGRWGVQLEGGTGHRVGGPGLGEGNLISGNVAFQTGGILLRGTHHTVQGNTIGLNADRSAVLPNGDGSSAYAGGIDVRSGSGHLIGGTGAGEANVIAGNVGHGIRIAAQTTRVPGNSLFGNLWLGIDLNADGVSANDGATNASQPNNGMDHPVLTGAGVHTSGTAVTVSGYVGTGTGQAVFAGARIEFFRAAVDPTGYGEGEGYLGALTADGDGRFTGTLAYASGALNVGDAITATATDSAGNTSEFGPNWVTTTLASLTPGNFNAFETDTAATAVTGVIRSKTAGVAATLAVVALDSAGTALHPGFTGSVALRWLDARDDTGAASGSCRASWVDLGAAGTATFSSNARVDVALTPPASATRAVRLQLRYTGTAGTAGTVTACSGDAFAALPASLSLVASDADAATAGTARALDNVSAGGGVVHRAGRPFTVTSLARDALGSLMTGYDGAPTLALAGCVLPSGCSAGALASTATSASGGTYSNASVTYAEVGAIALRLTDSSYADVDAADTLAAARTLASAAVDVGRFVPDSLSATVSAAGTLATANAACLASGQGATFFGQGLGWASAPQVTLTARNAAGGITTHWTGALMTLSPGAGLAPAMATSNAGSATLSASFGGVSVADLGGGQVRLSASSLDRFLLGLSTGTVQASQTPAWAWSLVATDASEASVSGNPTLSATATQASVGFDAGAVFHSGRLALSAAHGDARAGLSQLVQLQRYTSAGWVTMTEDRGCVSVLPQHLGVESPSGVFGTAGDCAAPMTASATTAGGRAWLRLPATPGALPGRLVLRLAGDGASGHSCTAGGASAALVPMDRPWLLGGSGAAGPSALATWGTPNRDAVLRRETW